MATGAAAEGLNLPEVTTTSLDNGIEVQVANSHGNDQLSRVFEDYMPVNGYVAVRSDTDGALFYCYGSVVDNVTNDPMTVLPQ